MLLQQFLISCIVLVHYLFYGETIVFRLSDCPIRDNQYFTTYNMYYTTLYKVT